MGMQEEELRRRRGVGAGGATGYEGIGGPGILANQFASYAAGVPQYSFSGLQGQGGLQAYLQSMANKPGRGGGPVARNLRNQGYPVDFPGLDTQMGIGAPGGPIGGPNVAPGSPQGLAIGQSGQLPPGLARQVADIPRTQGWRNLAGGYSAAAGAGFGSQEQGQFPGFGGGGAGPRGIPSTGAAETPGPGGGGGGGGRRQGRQGPAGGGAGPAGRTGGAPAAQAGAPGGEGTRPQQGGPRHGGGGGGAPAVGGGGESKGAAGGPKKGVTTAEAARGVGRRPGIKSSASSLGSGTGADTAKRGVRTPPPTAPSASNFGKRAQGGTSPIVGKKKKTGGSSGGGRVSTSSQQR